MNVGQTSILVPTVAATPAPGAEHGLAPTAADPAPFLALLLQAAFEPEDERAPDSVAPFMAPALPTPALATPLEFELPAPVVSAPPPTAHTGPNLGDAIKIALALGGVEPRVPDSTTDSGDPLPTTTSGFDASLATTRTGTPSPTNFGETVRAVLVPVGDRHWPDAVGHQVRLLVERGVSSATLRLSPEHLGPVEVRIEIVEDKANVWFGAAHGDTRAALADALPRLRDMLAGSGVLLGDAGVHHDAPGGSRDQAQPSAPGSVESESNEPERIQIARIGLVDAYA